MIKRSFTKQFLGNNKGHVIGPNRRNFIGLPGPRKRDPNFGKPDEAEIIARRRARDADRAAGFGDDASGKPTEKEIIRRRRRRDAITKDRPRSPFFPSPIPKERGGIRDFIGIPPNRGIPPEFLEIIGLIGNRNKGLDPTPPPILPTFNGDRDLPPGMVQAFQNMAARQNVATPPPGLFGGPSNGLVPGAPGLPSSGFPGANNFGQAPFSAKGGRV